MKCNICFDETTFFAKATILRKHQVSYYRCSHCGFIQTETPYWLNESYSSAITRSDIGLVSRNMMQADIVKCFIHFYFSRTGKFIDYGAGYGLFVRLMRDAGLDFYYYDSHCKNIFSIGFEADISSGVQYELLTSFEVLEHLVDPHAELRKMLSLSSTILFSMMLLPAASPKPTEWWYYGLDHGQHVSIYSPKTLRVLADQYKMNVYSSGWVHLFTKAKLNKLLFGLCAKRAIADIVGHFLKTRSLLQSDFAAMSDQNEATR